MIDIFEASAAPVSKVSFGANWDPVDGESIDLDLGIQYRILCTVTTV